MKKLLILFTVLALSLGLTGCADQGKKAELFAMDTVMSLTAYGDEADAALTAAQREINRLEALLSRTRPDSQVSRINDAGGGSVTVDKEVYDLLTRAEEECDVTGGAFDITVAPVVSAWGFTGEEYRVPGAAELTELLTHVGAGKLSLEDGKATLAPGASIDLGGIAKGYASDRVAGIFAEHGITSAAISLGGNVYVRGSKPDGSPWQVAIMDPGKENDAMSVVDPSGSGYLGTLSLTDAFAITSGGYQRYFEQNGKIYHHIIDPATGYPADSGLSSVTVVGTSGTQCDAYSTALFVLGEERALELWRQSGGAFGLVLATTDGRVLVTADLADKFQEEKDSGYDFETVS